MGEDTLLTCSSCGYSANEELAVGRISSTAENSNVLEKSELSVTIKSHIGIKEQPLDSTFLSFRESGNAVDGVQGYAAVLTPAGRPANLLKVQTRLSKYLKSIEELDEVATLELNPLSEQTLKETSTDLVLPNLHVFLDDSIPLSSQVEPSSILTVHPPDHFRIAKEGDHCTSCDNPLSSVKAIECGHTFYLGTKYSSILDCGFRKPNGDKIYAEMGCYGIGITRLLAALAEACQDEKGIVWPEHLAPYRVCIIPTDDRNESFKKVADEAYDKLNQVFKNDIVVDDRRSGFGAKIKDAELVGYPYTLIIGQKTLTGKQMVELHERVQGKESKKTEIPLDELVDVLVRL